jgi:hypothetical protein
MDVIALFAASADGWVALVHVPRILLPFHYEVLEKVSAIVSSC